MNSCFCIDRADDASTAALADMLRTDAPAQAPSGFTIGWAVRSGDETVEATIRRADHGLYAARAVVRGGAPHPSGNQ